MLLLSGATGRVGSAAAQDLDKANVPFRVLVRDPDKFKLVSSENVEVLQGDLENDDDVKAAMQGVSKALRLCHINLTIRGMFRPHGIYEAQVTVSHSFIARILRIFMMRLDVRCRRGLNRL